MDAETPGRIQMRGHHLFCITVMKNWTLWGPKFWENVKIYKKKDNGTCYQVNGQ